MPTAWVGIGANLGDPEAAVRAAIGALASLGPVRASSLYRTEPQGPSDQPWFVNAVAAVESDLGPLEILHRLQALERAAGRVGEAPCGGRGNPLARVTGGDGGRERERVDEERREGNREIVEDSRACDGLREAFGIHRSIRRLTRPRIMGFCARSQSEPDANAVSVVEADVDGNQLKNRPGGLGWIYPAEPRRDVFLPGRSRFLSSLR